MFTCHMLSHMLSDIVLTRDIISNKLSKLKVDEAPSGIDGIDIGL